MKLPNRERAVITQDKIVEYVLNTEHKRGGTKARLLAAFGYSQKDWRKLESDIRSYHLIAEVDVVRRTEYGIRCKLASLGARAVALTTAACGGLAVPLHPLQADSPAQSGGFGNELTIRTIWQVDEGADFPRLITLIPD